MSNLKEELASLTENYESPNLKPLILKLKEVATDGAKNVTLPGRLIDEWTINYLRNEGLTVKHLTDVDGDFLNISWVD